jgi:threonine synthase
LPVVEAAPVVTPEIVVAKVLPRLDISNPSQGPRALSARFTCDRCNGTTHISIAWDATAAERSATMKAALDEHRFVCPVGLPEEMRVYKIEYPR